MVRKAPFGDAEHGASGLDRGAALRMDGAVSGERVPSAATADVIRLVDQLDVDIDEFAGNEIVTERQSQDYRSIYLDLYVEFRKVAEADKESINDDIVFEIELIKQVEINVDYILMLVQKWCEAHGDDTDKKESITNIQRAVNSSLTLRNKRDLIMDFVDSVSASSDIDEEWSKYIEDKQAEELGQIITEERLNPEETTAFIESAFRDGSIPVVGTAITKILPPVSHFSLDGGYSENKQRVIARLAAFFERFFGLASHMRDDHRRRADSERCEHGLV